MLFTMTLRVRANDETCTFILTNRHTVILSSDAVHRDEGPAFAFTKRAKP